MASQAPRATAMLFLLLVCLCTPLRGVLALENGLARTPCMGYNTWYDMMCDNVSETKMRDLVNQMVDLGLDRLGYTYLNIDDCWASSRDTKTNQIVPDPKAFPSGMKNLVDYVHSKGLLFGIYTDRGSSTCAGRPGSEGFEEIDATTYADWGVDLVKEDSCNAPDTAEAAVAGYGKMRDALNKTGRPMVFNLCGWHPWYAPIGAALGNSWRVNWDGQSWGAVVANAITTSRLGFYARPGAWNDPDFLLGSSMGAAAYLTTTQSRMQFSLWSVLAAPLILGTKLLEISSYDLETYMNEEVIEVNQDPLGVQGFPIFDNCPSQEQLLESTLGNIHHDDNFNFNFNNNNNNNISIISSSSRGRGTRGQDARKAGERNIPACQQLLARPLADGGHALIAVNFAPAPASLQCDSGCFAQMGFTGGRRPANARDLWKRTDLGPPGPHITFRLDASGGFTLLRLTPGTTTMKKTTKTMIKTGEGDEKEEEEGKGKKEGEEQEKARGESLSRTLVSRRDNTLWEENHVHSLVV